MIDICRTIASQISQCIQLNGCWMNRNKQISTLNKYLLLFFKESVVLEQLKTSVNNKPV